MSGAAAHSDPPPSGVPRAVPISLPFTAEFSRRCDDHFTRPQGVAPSSRWQLPSPVDADGNGLVGVGADLAPGTLLAAYRAGLFPMPLQKRRLGWWSPDPRGVLPVDGLIVSRSLRRRSHRFELRLDTAFTEVMRACGDPQRPHGWITEEFVDAYSRLFDLGWAHSIEVWRDDELVGGLYGVRIARFFAGESMFHHATDASKVAMMGLVHAMQRTGGLLIDVQWRTTHLASLGVVDMPKVDYLRRLASATF